MIITIVRKPFKGSLVGNVQENQCGSLNIAASRIGCEKRTYKGSGVSQMRYSDAAAGLTDGRGRDLEYTVEGRWPANFILQTETATTLDEQSGILKSGSLSSKQYEKNNGNNRSLFYVGRQPFKHRGYEASEGGASRYFKVIK